MSEPGATSPANKKRRLSSSGRAKATSNDASGSNSDADGQTHIDRPSPPLTGLPHKTPSDHGLLHYVDGVYIKRDSFEPWNISGGFCDVFIGNHPKFGKIAMKRPRITTEGPTDSQLEAFMREGEIWKQLHHPNVLLFVGMIISEGRVWLFSPFAENGSLLQYLQKHPTADRHNLVRQFTSGLAYLHSKSIVHGDLKSKNLLISAKLQLLIADFGLSKLEGTHTNTSNKGAGTAGWMAPELLLKENPIKTSASDVYAYGITISEIIRGEEPFKGYENEYLLNMQVLKNNLRPPTFPQESPQGLTYAILWAVAQECWDAEPSKRLSMVDVCRRLWLDYTQAITSSIPTGATSAEEIDEAPGLTEPATTRSNRVLLPQETRSNPPPVSGTAVSSNTADIHLLQLLGNVDYGDIGHMLDDGLCLDGTRVEILKRLDRWADNDSSPRVLLVKGQAGRGKSTIARSVASRFRERWGDTASSAIFHFHRGNKDLDTNLLRALAHQLGRSRNQRVRSAVLKSIQTWHHDDARIRLEKQFEILFVESFKELEPNPPRILLIVDALDECSDRDLLSALLRLIPKYAASLPSTVKFLLTSRPEDHIVRPFNASFREGQEDLDAVDVGVIDRDVRAYFTTRLSEIQRYYGLESAWVSPEAVNELVSLSQGLFQWAHAAMEYVREQPDPRLQQLVLSPTAVLGLPSLYQQILSTAFPLRNDVSGQDSLPGLIQHVIGSLVVTQQPMSPSILEHLWDRQADHPSWLDPAKEIQNSILGRLGSILILPTSPDGPIHFMHTSIRDFFTDPSQCTDSRFLIDPAAHHARLANICFRQMTRDLKHDICGINDPSKMNSEVLGLVERYISAGLRYCCRFWSTHLLYTKDGGAANYNMLRAQLDDFCMGRILHWLEVLSFTDVLSEVFDILNRATEWIESKATPTPGGTQTDALIDDTYNLCQRFFKPMASNAQHITLSCLYHFPNETALRNVYSPSMSQQVPRILRGPIPHRSHWPRVISTSSGCGSVTFSPDGKILATGLANGTVHLLSANTGEPKGEPLIGHTNPVSSVAFSPDGKIVASGSRDKTVRLWSVATGQQIGEPLIGLASRVWSVAFSPDGKVVASGSDDNTVRLWSVATRQQIGEPLIGHASSVLSVAFSPDGKIVASGSRDNTVRLWSVATRRQMGKPLIGHAHGVWRVAFSPDGKVVASGSDDNTVRLWSVVTGQQIGEPLIGHTNPVSSVVFSPDGKIVASGSHDNTVRLWSVATRQQMEEPLTGHARWVWSVVFSPDGKIVASGSDDKTVRLWSVATRQQMGELLVGHAHRVLSITFSPDGKIVASGSIDKTVRLWSVATGQQIGEPLIGHTSSVSSIAFSPDGKIIASGSYDNTVWLWSVATRQQMGEPLIGHTDSVLSVAFSPDGKIVASGSGNKTVRLWSIATGQQIGEPLIGHASSVLSVAFSPDGKIVASGSGDNTVRLWSIATRQQIGEPLIGHASSVLSVAVSPDGKIVASGSRDDTVRLWNVATGQQTGEPLIGHASRVLSIAFSPDGEIITSTSDQETLQWHLRHKEPTTSQEYLETDPIQPVAHVGLSRFNSADASSQGWVFVRGKRCFWLPDEYYLDERRDQVKISLSRSILVLWHPNIRILDISAFL